MERFKLKSNRVENKQEKELNPEEKQNLSVVWERLILGEQGGVENVEKMSDDEFREWLSNSLDNSMEKLVEDWGLKIDENLFKKLETEADLEKKSEIEKEIIKNCADQISQKVQNFDHSEKTSRKWNSWPLLMKENNNFNCLGATMIGARMLKKLKTEQYLGSPTGHAVNVVKLSNGDWWYCDFLNDEKNIKKIEPETIDLNGVRALQINDGNLEYGIVLLREYDQFPCSILGNLNALKKEGMDDSIEDDKPSKRKAQKFLKRFSEEFKGVKFNNIIYRLYPEIEKIHDSEIMKDESNQFNLIEASKKEARVFLNNLEAEERKNLLETLKEKIKLVEDYFIKGEEGIFSETNENTKNFMIILKKDLDKLKEDNEKAWKKSIQTIIFSIMN